MGEALAATLALTLPVATLSWFVIERPVLRWARRSERARRRRVRPRLVTAETG